MKEDTKRCLESGMDGFVNKLVHLDELQTVLGEWLLGQGAGNQER
jgi:hypothetical protein